MLSDTDKKYLLSLRREDITAEWLYANIADHSSMKNGKMVVTKARFNPQNTFYLEAGEYFNKERVLTNVGLFIYNKVIVEEKFQNVLGYHNTTINSKVHGSIEDKLAYALSHDQISTEDFIDYLDRNQWLSMQFHSIIAGSYTMGTIVPNKKIIAEKNRLLKANKEQIDAGNIVVIHDIENKLVKYAQEELKNDKGMDLYQSGARGKFGNSYKNMQIMRGPIYNYSTGGYDLVTSNFTDGLKKEEMGSYGNSMIAGQYSKSISPAVAGYLSKRLTAAFQASQADVHGSDCGTKLTVSIKLTDANKKKYLDRYIVDGGKLVLLDNNNISKYVGEVVSLRSPMYCKGEKICNRCLGEYYYRLGITTVGMTAARASGTVLNLHMKQFHDSTINVLEIDLNDISV